MTAAWLFIGFFAGGVIVGSGAWADLDVWLLNKGALVFPMGLGLGVALGVLMTWRKAK